MRRTAIVRAAATAVALTIAAHAGAQAKSKPFTLPTPWTMEAVEAEVPLADYPRPQLTRDRWLCLNGMWDYMRDNSGQSPLKATKLPAFDAAERIRVPFAPESELSGVARKGDSCMWYRRTFEVPGEWKGSRVMLRFGAVDREAVVYVNGNRVGTHVGAYDAFAFDITDHLRRGSNELVVGAYDPNDGRAPSGKNGPRGDYTFSSGIWQTVWLEPVARQHIEALRLTPDVEGKRLMLSADGPVDGLTLRATASAEGKMVGSVEGNAGNRLSISLTELRLWSPDDPFLYDLNVELVDRRGRVVDAVKSYFGMRTVGLKTIDGVVRPTLNGEFVAHIGLLDQGYWPDGVFTAPTDEALRYDLELAKRAGFNVVRKHIKVEPQRWYYHCDRLGLMVWQDMPNLWEPDDADSVAVRKQFRDELKTMIDQHANSPSIVVWVPFNENWGAFEVADVTRMVTEYDPHRLVNGNSGYNYAPGYRPAPGDPGNGHFADRHHYGRIEPSAMARPDSLRAASLGEFGGKGLFVRGHMWPVRNDAYEMMSSSAALTDTYVMLATEVEQMINYFGLSCAIYTQTTDVEHEINGLVTYDRQVEKMDIDRVREINCSVIECTRRK